MYETFFGLERRPFLAVPDTDLFFSTASISETRQTVERIVRRSEGIALVLGQSGTGKTLLLRMLRKALDLEYTVSLLFNGRLETPKAFLQQVLFDLRLPFANADETELRLALWDFARQESTPGFVLLIDDAQYLGDAVLEEIRLLTNCDDGAAPFFRVVLGGTLDLEEKLTNPCLDAFNQRVVSRSYLDTLTREETANYVVWQTNVSRLRKFGQDLTELNGSGEFRRLDTPHGVKAESIFTDGAKRLIYQLTDGLPRLINQLCDAALVLAAERASRNIDETLLQTAWATLQQIPDEPQAVAAPTDDDPQTESLDELIARKKSTLVLKEFDSSIEFGTLDDPEPAVPPACSEDGEDDGESDDIEALLPIEEPIYVHASATVAEPLPPENEPCLVDAIDIEALLLPVAVQDDFQPQLDEVLDEMVAETAPLSVAVRRTIPYPVRRRNVEPDAPRKYRKIRLRRHRLPVASLSLTCRTFEASDPWIGCLATRILFLPVRLSAPTVTETSKETPAPMDQETLEQYGREVLEGRPPFVRKEPHYAYQAVSEPPSYPHPFYDLPLSWAAPQSNGRFGYGTAYSDFMCHEDTETEDKSAPSVAVIESPIVRLTLHSCRPMVLSPTTSFDEFFEEQETVAKCFVQAEEGHRREKPHRGVPLQQSVLVDDELTQKIEAVVHRIVRATEKIERAADVSESAGQRVHRVAEYVETEVQTVLPTYKECFRQLADFAEEVAALRMQGEAVTSVPPSPALPKQDKYVLLFPVAESKESKPSRLGSPQALFEFPNNETERRIDAKTLLQ